MNTSFPENKLKLKPIWEEKIQGGGGCACVKAPGGAAGGVRSDFEYLVMRKLRQEENRKRFMQEIMEVENGCKY